MRYDGSINISTKVDTKGFNTGTRKLSSGLGGLIRSVRAFGTALITAFGFAAIFRFISGIVQSFNVMASSVGASVGELSASLQSLKGSFVQLILTALAPIIPYLIQFANWLSRVIQLVTAFLAALFGIRIATAQAAGGLGDAAGGQSKLAKETKKANKEMKGQLAAFDQLNVLSQDVEPEVVTPPTGGTGGGGLPLLPELDGLPDIADKVQAFKEKFLAFIQPVIEAAGRLYDALVPLGQTIWEGLKWAWDNILVPIGEWAVNDLIPAFLDLLAAAAVVLNEALIALAPYAQSFFDDFLAPLGQFVGDAIIAFLKYLTEQLGELAVWIRENPEKFANFVKILGVLALIIGAVALALFLWLNPAYLIAAAIIAIIAIILNWGKVWEWVKLVASEVWKDIQKVWTGVAAWFKSSVIDPTKQYFSDLWNSIIIGLAEVGKNLSTKLRDIREGFTSSLREIREGWTQTFIGIANIVRSQINYIIGFINTMISGVVSGINGIIGSLNRVGALVPGFRSVATVSAPQIPHLATGAVIPPNAQFLAMLGDNKTQKEIVSPEDMLRRIVREESGNNGKQEIVIRFEGTMSQFVRELKPVLDKETIRRGGTLITGGVS